MDGTLVVNATIQGGATTRSVTLTTGYKKCEITMINYGGPASVTLRWNGGPTGAATMGDLPWQLVLPVGGRLDSIHFGSNSLWDQTKCDASWPATWGSLANGSPA